MKTFSIVVANCGLLLALAADARSDFLIYKVPLNGLPGSMAGSADDDDEGSGGRRPSFRPNRGNLPPAGRGTPPGAPGAPPTEIRMLLTGKAALNGRTVSYTHPTFKAETHYFNLDDVEYIKAPTSQQEFNRRVSAAAKDADAMMAAAIWGLKKGLLREFYQAVDKTLGIDSKHEGALRIKALKQKIDQPCPDNPALEKELRNFVRQPGMSVATSNHFILLHDTPAKAATGRKKNRAQERLDLLEEAYESFLMLFQAQGVELDIPRDRLKVVLFKEQKDYDDFVATLNPALASAAGFWEPFRNVSVFNDHVTDSTIEALEKIQDDNKKKSESNTTGGRRSRPNPQWVRFAKIIDLLIDVSRENADITVVSHEVIHQLAGNTGLFPRQVEIPRWVHEGLATYFESPPDAAWAGIGAVSEQRLTAYRALEGDRAHSNIDFIVADQVFDFARMNGTVLNGYGQAWAMTHFLMENHLKELVIFYHMLGDMPPNVTLNPSLLTDMFNQVFGSDHKALDQEWRQYMKSLRTDQELLEEAGSKRGA